MSSDSEKKGGSKGMMAFGMFLIIVLFVLVTWAVLAFSGCTPKNNGVFGSYCNPFPFGGGGSCGGSNGNGGKCINADPAGKYDCSADSYEDCLKNQSCKWEERYRRFNRSPRRREGYRRFARR